MEDCSKSWLTYGFAAVSGVLVVETFIIAAYCFVHQNGKKRKYKNRHNAHEETLPRYTSSTDHNIETVEETRIEQHKEHNQQNGHSNQINSTTDLQLVPTTPVQGQVQNLITGKKTEVSKPEKKKGRCQRIDPHHRSKQRIDIIRINSISTDNEKEETPLKNKDAIGLNAKNQNGVVSQGVNKQSNKSPSGSQRGIMKSCQGSVVGQNDSLDSITGRPKKSVRFDLKRFKAADSDENSVPSTLKKSKISIISANKHDENVKIMLKGHSDYADTAAPERKRTFIVISDEEDEAGIVEIEPKNLNPDRQIESSEKMKYTDMCQNSHDDMDEVVNDRKDSITVSSEENVINLRDSNSNQDVDRNQHSSTEDKNGNILNENNANKIHGQNGREKTETSPSKIHSSEDTGQTTHSDKPTTDVNILSTPQTVVLIENDKKEIVSHDNESTDKIPNSNGVRKTPNTSIRNVNNNYKKPDVTSADNTRNPNVIIISSQDEDVVAQSIARGHVNSMIKMFQKIEGGKELTQEYNC